MRLVFSRHSIFGLLALGLAATWAVWDFTAAWEAGLAPLRDDNFWSFTSGFHRRALVGELIYQLDLLTGYGTWIMYGLFLGLYVAAITVAWAHLARSLPLWTTLLMLASPFFLHFGIDGEVVLLLPLFALVMRPSGPKDALLLAAIAISIAVRELALILYAPVLLYYLRRGGWQLVTAVVILAASLWLLFWPHDLPNLSLEIHYWPQIGYDELVDSWLYTMASKTLADILFYHGWVLYRDFWIVLPGMLGAVPFLLALVYRRSGSALTVLWFAAALVATFILTIDYGRYFYLVLIYAVMVSHPAARAYFHVAWLPRLNAWAEHHIAPVLEWVWGKHHYFMLLFLLAPVGFATGRYEVMPRIWVLVAEFFGFAAS